MVTQLLPSALVPIKLFFFSFQDVSLLIHIDAARCSAGSQNLTKTEHVMYLHLASWNRFISGNIKEVMRGTAILNLILTNKYLVDDLQVTKILG